MTPDRVLFIRHAEEHDTAGVTGSGRSDRHSLTIRGWQRAGALARFFDAHAGSALAPDFVFASSIGPGSESRRPQQTVAPLVALMRQRGRDGCSDEHAKTHTLALMADVLRRPGTILVSWEHSRIAECVAVLPNPPQVPDKWPSDRYDLVWVLDRAGDGWTFRALPQHLLAGDGPAP